MARLPRINLPDIPQHIIQRGNNRQACFYHEHDYAFYLSKLLEYTQKYEVEVHAFVLMTNHVHLLLTPKQTSAISQVMQALGRSYVRYINTRYQRTGTLWEGRHKASLVDSEHYFLILSRYIELNPVRANMTSQPGDYPWSSYQGNALGKSIKLLTPHKIYQQLGHSDSERQLHYRELCKQAIPQKTIDELRHHTNKGWVIGDEQFKKDIEAKLARKIQTDQHGGDRKSKRFKPSNQ